MTALTTPREGIPRVLSTPADFTAAASALASGQGPLAIDTERASGFRYDDRAFLVQVRRRGDTRFWGEVIQRALDSDPRTWPARERPPRGLPSRQTWASDYPESWERFSTARTLLDDLSADLAIPAENILKPATLRSVAWGATVAREIRTPLDLPDVLRGHQARNWQIELTAPVLTDTLF